MRTKSFLAALALTTIFAQSVLASDVWEVCKGDIDFYCGDVEVGDGRLIACLYSHSATLSDECHKATQGASTLLEHFFDEIATVSETCRPDVEKHCDGSGSGNRLQCLSENRTKLSGDCKSDLTRMNDFLQLEPSPQ